MEKGGQRGLVRTKSGVERNQEVKLKKNVQIMGDGSIYVDKDNIVESWGVTSQVRVATSDRGHPLKHKPHMCI